MEDRAHDVLRGKVERIKTSKVDPNWLAEELLAARIITGTDLQRDSSGGEATWNERLEELINKVMQSEMPDVFQTFVGIFLRKDDMKWLGEELKADFIEAGGAWRKDLTPFLQSEHPASPKLEEDVGYSAVRVNCELLTETIDPRNVFMSMFSYKLISLEEIKEIERVQVQSGRKCACEELMYLLLGEWRRNSYDRFLNVLSSCKYEECRAQLKKSYESECLAISADFMMETTEKLCPDFATPIILDTLNDAGFSAAYWRELGGRLKPDLDMDAIEANNSKVERCLEDIIEKWQRDGDGPSWASLAEAVGLCRKGGGINVAQKIRKKAGLDCTEHKRVGTTSLSEVARATSDAKERNEVSPVLPERYKHRLKRTLHRDSKNVAMQFFDLIVNTKDSLVANGTSVTKLKEYISFFPLLKGHECPTLADRVETAETVFKVIFTLKTNHFITFYKFSILEGIIRHFSTESDGGLGRELEKYKEKFKIYIKRRVCETSLYYSGEFTPGDVCALKEGCNLVLITDESWNPEATLEAVLDLEDHIADAFGINDFVLHLKAIEKNCLRLYCIIPADVEHVIHSIKYEQVMKLISHGIAEIYCRNSHIALRTYTEIATEGFTTVNKDERNATLLEKAVGERENILHKAIEPPNNDPMDWSRKKAFEEECGEFSGIEVCDEHAQVDENSCDSASFWLLVLQKQMGVKSERARKYVGGDLYPHLVQFARTPQDKKALKELLKVRNEESSFGKQREYQRENLRSRNTEIGQMIQKLNILSKESKYCHDEVKQLENSLCENLQIPSDFWPFFSKSLKEFIVQFEELQLKLGSELQRKELNDASVINQASGGRALQGILLTKDLDELVQRRQALLKLPGNVHLKAPFHSQHVMFKQFESQQQEKVFTDTTDFLGYSVTMVDYMGMSFNKPTVHTVKETYCSTVGYFVLPLASCCFEDDQLELSDDAIKDLKTIEKMIDSSNMSLQSKCEEFFEMFGSHISKGPLHFGGTYRWTFHSSGFQESDRQVVQQNQKEIIYENVRTPLFTIIDNVPHSVPYCEAFMYQSFWEVAISGGPQGLIGLPGWKNGLTASNTTWSLIDRGTTLFPVWSIVRNNHKDDFKRPYSLATLLNQAWNTMNQHNPGEDMQDLSGDVENVLLTIPSWNKSPHITNCKDWLEFLKQIKQNVAEKSLSPKRWPTVYLSQPSIQKALKLVVDSCIHCSSAESKSSAEIRAALRMVVEPIDLDTVRIFPCRKYISQWAYSTETSPIPMDCDSMLSLLKYFQYASHHMKVGLKKNESLLAIRPDISTSLTQSLTEAVYSFTNHLSKTGQRYEEMFLITMLLPINYNPDQHVFFSSLSVCDIKYLCNKFDHHCKQFFKILEQLNIVKAQAYLFLLTLEMHSDLCTSNSHMRFSIQHIQQMIGNDTDPQISAILLELSTNECEWEWLKSQLLSLCDESEKNLPIIHKMKKNKEFFSVLGLNEFYPQRLTLHHALEIREDTLESMKHPQDSGKYVKRSTPKPAQTTDPKLYPFLILQRIMAFDYRCRIKLVLSSNYSTSIKLLSDVKKKVTELVIHPMDGLLAVLHCSDNFLRQDLVSRLATCQVAVPLLLPDPFVPHKLTFPIWTLRTIVREWQVFNGSSKEGQLVSYPSPLVSFLRIGKFHVSKSHLMNKILSDSGHDIFFHYNCMGGRGAQLLVDGLVEVCWYLPSKSEMIFPDVVTFANLHGDAQKCTKQVNFLSKVSFINIVFISAENRNNLSFKILQDLATAPGGLVLLQEGSSDNDDLWHAWLKPLSLSITFIKLEEANEAEICEEIREGINSKLIEMWDNVAENSSLEKHSDTARLCNIFVDEDDEQCLKSKELAMDFEKCVSEFKKSNPSESLKKVLPLQSHDLWQKWALTKKEEYRQTQRGQCEVEAYAQEQRKKMEYIRKTQLDQTQHLQPLMVSILTSLLACEPNTKRRYFLQWVQLLLDNLTRKQLPQLHIKYEEKVSELKGIQLKKQGLSTEQVCKDEIQKLNTEIIDASIGVEHLLREVSQMYEAVAVQKEVPKIHLHFLRLPEVAAELMIEGYPLELMDGDAAHVPTSWVSAVLSKVQELLDNPNLFVISVLGVQSSGKSTLLNTVFGVQLKTSAGRCTRGAFMQLLPIHSSLRHEYKCDYFLIVDTEGLRAPQLAEHTIWHDNELAAFVIGLANVTVINLYGETMGDMDDILQTAVHSFLRMKRVQLKPSCIMVHQNVTAVKAREKSMMGRVRLMEALDMKTQAAAREEGLEDQYRHFTEVIDFNSEKHVFFFQSLWKGDPPMAPINPGYSTDAQLLKLCLVTHAKQAYSTDFKLFQMCLKELWKAIIHENFVFSFKNVLEITAYNTLDVAYSNWSWQFKQDMITWEHNAHNKMKSCEISKLPLVYDECCVELPKHVLVIHHGLKKEMEWFFEHSAQQEIIIKWKGEMETRLDNLKRQLEQQAEDQCKLWKTKREVIAKVDDMKETYRGLILDHVKLLASQLVREKLNDKQLEEKFNELWIKCIAEIESLPVHTVEVYVKGDVQKCLTGFEPLRPFQPMVIEKLHTNPLEKGVPTLQLDVTKVHVKERPKYLIMGHIQYASEFPVRYAQGITDKVLECQKEYLQQMMKHHYNPNLATDLLRKLFNDISRYSTDITFTEEYKVDMALRVCQYATVMFQEMVVRESKRNNPVTYLEREMRGPLLKIFTDNYYQIAREVAAASAVCNLLLHSVKKEVNASLSQKIADGMRKDYKFLHTKPALRVKVLCDIGDQLDKQSEGHFDDCMLYLTDVAKSLRCWLERYTIQYCQGDKFAEIASAEISNHVKLLTDKVHDVSMEFPEGGEFKITEWLTKFHNEIQSTGTLHLDISELQQLGGVHQLKHVSLFTEGVSNGLKKLSSTLQTEMCQEQMKNWMKTPHDYLFEALAGCTEQCPFCKEQCDFTIPNHSTKHCVAMHRPECLGSYCWEKSEEMDLDMCTASVASDLRFRNSDTKGEYHPYKEYATYYPQWSITADLSLEASLYWKWLLGKYTEKISMFFKMKPADIPSEWKEVQWSDVKQNLNDVYNL